MNRPRERSGRTLVSPGDGREQYRIVEPGEVLAAGGKVLSLLDLRDVSLTFFLPTAAAGRVQIGADVRLVLDAAPRGLLRSRNQSHLLIAHGTRSSPDGVILA